VAVFGERRAGRLTGTHLITFWIGLAFDITGTTLMGELAGGLKADLHGILGVGAILLMLLHCVWATIAYVRKQEQVLRDFHKFSLVVWTLWMIALVTGFVGVGLRAMLS